ncbi:MAG TPA: sodium:solute symporter family protein, partial [Clostridiales bacterium]|nr:sodium:solute symporter family protein [Clostridiales bacterium]
ARRTRDVTQRLKIKTMPQYLEKRYQSGSMRVFSALVIFIFLVPYSASVYKGIASISKVMLSENISDKLWLVIIAVVAMLILVFGGYVVQARADFVQGIMMIIGMVALLAFIIRSSQVGGPAGIIEYVKSDIGLPALKGPQWVALISLVLMTSFGTWGLPHMIQKYFGIKSDRQAKMGTVISTLFCLLIAGGGYFIGSLVFKILTPSTIDGLKAQYPQNFKDYLVPTILKTVQLPDILVGLTLVMLIAASVTTLCSLSLTASSVLSLDFIKSSFKKDMGDKSAANMTKIIGVLFIVVSYIVANTKTPILDMMAYSWGILSGSFLAPYAIALFWKGLNKAGAWAGILVGFCVALPPAVAKMAMVLGFAESSAAAGGPPNAFDALAGKGPNYAVLAMLCSIAVCVVVSLIANAAGKKQDNEFFYTGVVQAE